MDSWVINLKCYKYRYKIIFQYITKMGRKIALRFLGLRFSIKFYISTMYQHSHANYHYRNTYVPMNKWSTCCKSAEVTTTYKRIQNFCLEKKKHFMTIFFLLCFYLEQSSPHSQWKLALHSTVHYLVALSSTHCPVSQTPSAKYSFLFPCNRAYTKQELLRSDSFLTV